LLTPTLSLEGRGEKPKVPRWECGRRTPPWSAQRGGGICVGLRQGPQRPARGDKIMPIILWLLGVPLSVIILLAIFGVF
jgi:hypothetical protein